MPWTIVRHPVRRLLKAPLFTIATLVTLAVGVGANTAIFSIVSGVLLKPLPFEDPETLTLVGARPAGARLFTRDDTAPGLPQRVILTWGYWQRRFGGREVVGQKVVVDGAPVEIIGVRPQSFSFPDQATSMALPLQFDRAKVFAGHFSCAAWRASGPASRSTPPTPTSRGRSPCSPATSRCRPASRSRCSAT